MGKSGRVRLSDLRAAFRLIGECRDLRADSASWRLHAHGGLCRLVGARAAVGGECRWHRPAGVFVVLQLLDLGLTPAQFDAFREFMRLCGLKNDPIFAPLNELTGRLVTRTRSQLVDDRDWYGSDGYNIYRRPIEIDHCIHSICDFTPDGGNNVIGLHRDVGEHNLSRMSGGCSTCSTTSSPRSSARPWRRPARPHPTSYRPGSGGRSSGCSTATARSRRPVASA